MSDRPPSGIVAWVRRFMAFAIVIALVAPGISAEMSQSPAPATQVWLVDTRCAPGCGDLETGFARINYWRLEESGGRSKWTAADAARFGASADPAVPTTVLIHGYGTDSDWAVRHGYEVLGQMRGFACGRPFRLVIWSWPAEHTVRGVRKDIQMKACRSDAEAYYLARVLSVLPRGEPLSLLGFSLGCRTSSGALQLLAGGAAGGRSLPPASLQAWQTSGRRPIRVMMVAAAIDDDWLEPSAPGGLASVAVERILVSENCRDRVLRWYSRLYGPHGPEALGHSGPAGPDGGKLEVVDVTCAVGRTHDFDRYEEAPAICQRLGWYTFLCGDAPVINGTVVKDAAKKADLAVDNRGSRK